MIEEEDWSSDRYSPEDAPDVLRLLNETSSEGELTSSYLDWQFQRGPGGAALVMLARDSKTGRVVGESAAVPVGVRMSGKSLTAGLTLSPAVDPRYHGRAIPGTLVSALNPLSAGESFSFSYAFPDQASLSSFTDQAGFKEVASLPFLIRPLNPERLATKASGSRVLARRAIARIVWRTPAPAPHHERLPGLEIEQVERFEEPFAIFWHRVQNQCPLMVIRDPAYLNWRFIDVPGRDYTVYTARSEGKIRGYIALRVAPYERFLVGFIVDLLFEASGEGRAAGRILVDHATAAFKALDLDMLAALALRHTDEYRLLRSNGFWAPPKFLEPRPLRFVLRAHEPAANAAFDLRKWLLTLADTHLV